MHTEMAEWIFVQDNFPSIVNKANEPSRESSKLVISVFNKFTSLLETSVATANP